MNANNILTMTHHFARQAGKVQQLFLLHPIKHTVGNSQRLPLLAIAINQYATVILLLKSLGHAFQPAPGSFFSLRACSKQTEIESQQAEAQGKQ